MGAALVHVLDAAIFYNFYLVGARASHSSPLLVPLVPTGTPTNTPVPGTTWYVWQLCKYLSKTYVPYDMIFLVFIGVVASSLGELGLVPGCT